MRDVAPLRTFIVKKPTHLGARFQCILRQRRCIELECLHGLSAATGGAASGCDVPEF